MIAIGIEGGGVKSKISEARFWERGLTISPPKILILIESVPIRIFRRKKNLAGEDPLDPLMLSICDCNAMDEAAGAFSSKSGDRTLEYNMICQCKRPSCCGSITPLKAAIR